MPCGAVEQHRSDEYHHQQPLRDDELEKGLLYPPRDRLREVSQHVATAVAEQIFDEGHARVERPADLATFVASKMWTPAYRKETT